MKVSYIELLGRKYPLCFSLAASQKISDEFGGMDKMQEALGSGDIGKMAHAVDVVLSTLMDAGQIYCRMANMECPEPLSCRPADVIDLSDPEAIKTIFAAMAVGSERDVEVASKNVTPTQGK